MAGAILHAYNPPPFTHAWLGPWVALGSAAVAVAASGWLLARGLLRPLRRDSLTRPGAER